MEGLRADFGGAILHYIQPYNNDEIQAFQLAGNRYQAMELLAGRIWIPDLELGLALWQGEYRGKERQWLRWYDVQGNWIPTEAERVKQVEQRAQQAQQRAEQESQQRELAKRRAEEAERRAEELAQRLRSLGLEP